MHVGDWLRMNCKSICEFRERGTGRGLQMILDIGYDGTATQLVAIFERFAQRARNCDIGAKRDTLSVLDMRLDPC